MLVSEFFPAWYLGRNPDRYVITSSYAQELSDDFGRKVRNQMLDPMHQGIFPECRISQDSQAASRFTTKQGGSYFAVGVGGPTTGRGAHLFLIDDPIKNRKDAESEVKRKDLKDWYKSVAYTRLMPNAAIAIIATRWMEDDLTGWVLKEHSHENWTVIDLPAIDKGNPLWPEAYPLEDLERIKKTIGQREWNSLYMQNPMPEEGDYFQRHMFKWYEPQHLPKHLNKYGASDYAVTDGNGDYTEHGVIGVSPDNDVYFLDWWDGQTASDVWIDTEIDLITRHRPLIWAGESGPIRRSIEPFLLRRMNERRAFCRLEWLASIHDKPTRARSFQALAANGKVYLPTGADWATDLFNQLLRFPAGALDDKVDVCSLFGRLLDQIWAAHNPPEHKNDDIFRPLTLNERLQMHDRKQDRRRRI